MNTSCLPLLAGEDARRAEGGFAIFIPPPQPFGQPPRKRVEPSIPKYKWNIIHKKGDKK